MMDTVCPNSEEKKTLLIRVLRIKIGSLSWTFNYIISKVISVVEFYKLKLSDYTSFMCLKLFAHNADL